MAGAENAHMTSRKGRYFVQILNLLHARVAHLYCDITTETYSGFDRS